MDYTDKDMLTDALSTQKFITETYNSVANECSADGVREVFMSILNDEHTMQHDVFCEMSRRGWYQTEQAPQQKIDCAKQKFNS